MATFYICLEVETYDFSAKVKKKECIFDSTNKAKTNGGATRLFYQIYGLKSYGLKIEKVMDYIWEEEEFISLRDKIEAKEGH